jgi:hypothetical protein
MAKYTDAQKQEIIKKAEETSVSEAAKEYGVDRKTIRGWMNSASGNAEPKKSQAGRKVKETIGEKIDNKKLANQMTVGRIKAKRERKSTDKATAKAEKAAVKAADKEEKASRKPAVKRQARKMNILFQSQSGGAVTSEQIAMRVPKEAVDVYVKLEENKIYWVDKNGKHGSVDIW